MPVNSAAGVQSSALEMIGDLLTSALVRWIGGIVIGLHSATDFLFLGLACGSVIAGALYPISLRAKQTGERRAGNPLFSKYFFNPVSILARGTISVAVVVLAMALGLCVGVLCAGAVTYLLHGWDFTWDSGPILFWMLFIPFGGFGLIIGVMFGLVLASLLWTAEKDN